MGSPGVLNARVLSQPRDRNQNRFREDARLKGALPKARP